MDVDHVALPVSDLAATRRFYTEGLDLAFSHEFVGEDGLHNSYVAGPSGAALQFTWNPDGSSDVGERPGNHLRQHVAIGVADIDTAFDQLVGAVDPLVICAPSLEEASGATIAFVRDPDGHVVELVERPPDGHS